MHHAPSESDRFSAFGYRSNETNSKRRRNRRHVPFGEAGAKVEQLGKRDHTSDVVLWYRGWDIASSTDKTAAYTCGVKTGCTKDGKYVVGHVAHARGKRCYEGPGPWPTEPSQLAPAPQ
jgi:hypothetical protein